MTGVQTCALPIPKEETNALQEPMEKEIAEIESSLDEKEVESDEQKEEEWSSYPCLPSNEGNSLTLTLFDCPPCLPKEDECHIDECDDPINSFEISFLMKLMLAILVTMMSLLMKLVRMIWLLLFMIIHVTLINPMIILYLVLLLICMIMRKLGWKIYMIILLDD